MEKLELEVDGLPQSVFCLTGEAGTLGETQSLLVISVESHLAMDILSLPF